MSRGGLVNDDDPITLESLQTYDPRSIVKIKIGDRFAGFYVMSIYTWIGTSRYQGIPILNPLTGTEIDAETICFIDTVKKRWIHSMYQEELDRRYPKKDDDARIQIFVKDPVNSKTWTFMTRLDEDVIRFTRLLSDAFGYSSSHNLRFTYCGKTCYSGRLLADIGIRDGSMLNSVWAATTSHFYTHVPSLLSDSEG